MIEYLEKLVEDKEFQKALDYAEQLLLNVENTSWDLMVIYSRLCQARYETGEFYGAQVAGQLAVKMSEEQQAWDYHGIVTFWLGASLERLRQPESALLAWYDYLAYVHQYGKAAKYHVAVLYNISLVQARTGQHEDSLQTLQKAAHLANSLHDHRKAHGIRHALISAHLEYGDLDQVPRLLARSAHYLRHNTTASDYLDSRLWHQVLRVRYAIATNRPVRAMRVAQRGLELAKGRPGIMYQLRLLMARVHERRGETRLALEQAIRARGVAIDARRFDLEFTAASFVYELLSLHPQLTETQPGIIEAWDPLPED